MTYCGRTGGGSIRYPLGGSSTTLTIHNIKPAQKIPNVVSYIKSKVKMCDDFSGFL